MLGGERTQRAWAAPLDSPRPPRVPTWTPASPICGQLAHRRPREFAAHCAVSWTGWPWSPTIELLSWPPGVCTAG